jgi:hypothetical protein
MAQRSKLLALTPDSKSGVRYLIKPGGRPMGVTVPQNRELCIYEGPLTHASDGSLPT